MRFILTLLISQLAFCAAAAAQERYREVVVDDPYIEMHTGPGRGYPIFYVGERGEPIELMKRRTEWFKIRTERGQEGWVHQTQLQTTLNLDGQPFDLPGLDLDDYADRNWEVGVSYGDFGGANAISTYGSYAFTPNLSGELWVTQMLGRFSDGTAVSLGIVHLMYPERRVSPFFTLGAGTIDISPKATLVATIDRSDSTAHAGAGVRVYLTRRFVFRADYKSHVVFTSRNDNEEIREWKAGFSFFF